MSQHDGSSSSDDDSEPRESLVAGREKRSTAGNRLSHLLKHLDDEDIKADLLAEEDDDQQDYSASDNDEDGDVGLVSSSDDDDNEDNDPTRPDSGEKELLRQERHESSKKRKARDIVRIQPMHKRQRTSAVASGRPRQPRIHKNIVERVSAFQTPDNAAPVRQSSRTQTVANAIVTEARLNDHYKRALKAQEIMKRASEKKAADALPALTQADRIARALDIEKDNSQSLNRWEHFEQDRIRLQREKLESMRNRKLCGPVIRYRSGPVTWSWREGPDGPVRVSMKYGDSSIPKSEPAQDLDLASQKQDPSSEPLDTLQAPLPSMPPYQHIPTHLSHIEDHSISHLPIKTQKAARTLITLESFDSLEVTPQPKPSRRFASQGPGPHPLTAILLPNSQPDLTPEERRYLTARMKPATKPRESQPGVRAYTRKEEGSLLPAAPARAACSITGKPARFRDPNTGLCYRDLVAYRAIQRVVVGEAHWSCLLGVWTGIVGQGSGGRAAKGVPDGFWTGVVADKVSS